MRRQQQSVNLSPSLLSRAFTGERKRRLTRPWRLMFPALALFVTLALIAWPTQARENADTLTRVWRNVKRGGAYEFKADITQYTVPVAGVRNAGRASERQDLRLEGQTDLHEETLSMTLWSGGGNVLDSASGLEIKSENSRMWARQGEREWQEVSDFSDALMPGGDFMTFLAGARDVTDEGQETRNGQTFTRYTFHIDGQTFAAHLRQQVEAQLLDERALVPGTQVQLPDTFTKMTGNGELWVDEAGLPLRQIVRLQSPAEDGYRTESEITVNFSNFAGRDLAFAATAFAGALPVLRQALLAGAVAAALFTGTIALLLLGTRPPFAGALYRLLVVAVILSMSLGTLLQGVQAEAASGRFRTRQERQQKLLQEAQAAQQMPAPGRLPGAEKVEKLPGSEPLPAQLAMKAPQTLPAPKTQALAAPQAQATISDDGTDSDGDGLTDYEETQLGTIIDQPDSDGDGLTDHEEIAGIEWPAGSGQMWHTDPLEIDSNHDGVGDASEWYSGDLHPTWDTDGDNVPDLFDEDNDGDGVPDRQDISPFMKSDTVFTAGDPFSLVLDGLAPDRPTLVELQLRPTNPDHLWYALNKLDWPADEHGNIRDIDGTPDDVELIPMLEIIIPDAPSNLPLATPVITVPVAAATSLPDFLPANQVPISGTLVLTQDGAGIAVDADLSDASFLYIREGTCQNPGARVGDEVTVAGTPSGDTVALDGFENTRLADRATGNYIIQVGRNNDNIQFGCGAIPHVPFEGDQMIDTARLASYGVSVRELSGNRQSKAAYVPLNLVVDDPAGLNNNDALPATTAPRGGRVAFNAIMPYLATGTWGRAHEMRLVWSVLMEQDRPCPEGVDNCAPYYNIPAVIHTYADDWTLTGLDVREENGVTLATVYEDPLVDNNLHDDAPLLALSVGLSDSFLAGRQQNGQRDFPIGEIARRFDHGSNAVVSIQERWAISNTLSVTGATYPTLEAMARDTTALSEKLLDTVFSSAWSATNPVSPTLLYAFEWDFRVLNLDAAPATGDIGWDGNGRQLTFDFNGSTAPLQTTAGMKAQPYFYDEGNSAWQTFAMADFWQELAHRYEPILAGDPDPDAAGKLGVVQLYYFMLNAGVQQTVEVANQPISLKTLDDTGIAGINGKAAMIYTVTYLPGALLDARLGEGAGKSLLHYIKVGMVAPVGEDIERVQQSLSRFVNAENGFLLASFVTVAILVVAQIALTIAMLFDLPDTAATAITITVSVLNTVLTVYTGIYMPIQAGLNTAKAAGQTFSILGLTSALSSIKAATIIAVVGLVIQLGVVWGYFIYAVASGQASSGSSLHALVAFSIAATLVALVYFAIALIPIAGPIIVAILSVIDFILTIVCEAGVDELRGLVTEGSDSCLTISGALTEALVMIFYQSDIIFEFDSKYVAERQRFPQLLDFGVLLGQPSAGLVVSNTVQFEADVGGTLGPSIPKAQVEDAYGMDNIRRTGITAEMSNTSRDLTTTAGNLANQGWGIRQATTVKMQVTASLFPPWIYEDQFPLYAATVPPQPVASEAVTLTQAGLNADYMLPVYLNIGLQLPLYSCIMGFCETDQETSGQSLSEAILKAPDFVFDVLPATLDGFYARDWGTFQVEGEQRGIPFGAPADFDGDGLRNADAGGLDPDDNAVDSDGDGLPDGYEMETRSLGTGRGGAQVDPEQADSDGDGVCDTLELRLGTRPELVDTDGDGLEDGEELLHPDCDTGTWTGGWSFTYNEAGDATLVTSNPLAYDSDGDGMSDHTEKRLHEMDAGVYRYHPLVFNESPVGIYPTSSDADAVVSPGTSFVYTATVANRLNDNLYAAGALTRTFPAALGSQTQTGTFQLFRDARQSFATNLTASGGSQVVQIGNELAAHLLDSAGATPDGAPAFILNQGFPVTIDDDRPTSSLTSGEYVRAGGYRVLGGTASDPTSYISGVEVRIGQDAWIPAGGAESWAFSWEVPDAEGRYTLQTRARDAVAHLEDPPNSTQIVVDGTPPSLATIQTGNPILPTSRDATLRWTIALQGTVADPAVGSDPGSGVAAVQVKVEPRSTGWAEATFDASGNWLVNYPLSDFAGGNNWVGDATGQYTVTVRAADSVGNLTAPSAPLEYLVRVDNTAPVATLDSLEPVNVSDGAVVITRTHFITRNIVLTGTATDPGSVSAGVAKVELSFTPSELLDTLDRPLLLWYLNEPAGLATFADGSGNGYAGQCLAPGCPAGSTDGFYGGAVSFDGTDDVITATVDIPEDETSISLWFNTADANGGLFSTVASPLGAEGYDRSLYLVDGNICAFVQGAPPDTICTAGTDYNDGQWHQVVLVLDPARPFRLYVDGEVGATAGSLSASTFVGQNAITLGFARDQFDAERYLDGRIDELEIYDAALSAEAITALFRRWQETTLAASGPGVSSTTWSYEIPSGLEGLFQIDLRAGDEVGNRNDEARSQWKQWQGIIDTAPPRINFDVEYTGNGDTARTVFTIEIEDFNLTTEGYSGECDIGTADYTYDSSEFWAGATSNTPRLTRLEMTCSSSGHQVGYPSETGVVDFSATACDAYGHCAYATPNRQAILWSTALGTDPSTIYRQNINAVDQLETVVGDLPHVSGLDVDGERGHMYWLERGDSGSGGQIRRADLDGENVTTIDVPAPDASVALFPVTLDLVVNAQSGKIYWSEDNRIRWANLDGSAAATLFTLSPGPTEPDRIGRLVVDPANAQLFFSVSPLGSGLDDAQIWTMDADGGNPQVVVGTADLQDVWITDLALTRDGQRLYWLQRDPSLSTGTNGLFYVDLPAGSPVNTGYRNEAFPVTSILEISSGRSYAYWSDNNLINKLDLGTGDEGFLAGAPEQGWVSAAAIARVPGFSGARSDLALTKRAAGTSVAVPGETIDFELLAQNHGPVGATGITIVDTLPSNTAFVATGSSPACVESTASSVTCTLDTLANGETRSLNVRLLVDGGASGNLVNSATITSASQDPDPGNNRAIFGDVRVAPPPTPVPATNRYVYWGSNEEVVRHLVDTTNSLELIIRFPDTRADDYIEGFTVDTIAQKIYWTARHEYNTSGPGLIQRANYDGTDVETVYQDATAPYPGYLALDEANGHLYFTHGDRLNGDAIKRINTDGSGEVTLVGNIEQTYSLAVNPVKGEIYWSDGAGTIHRANLDGTAQAVIHDGDYSTGFTVDPYADYIYFLNMNRRSLMRIRGNGTGLEEIVPPDVATGPVLDLAAGKLYWGKTAGGTELRRADLDGSNVETVLSGFNLTFPTSRLVLIHTDAQLPPTPTPTSTGTPTDTPTPTNTPTPAVEPTATPTPLPSPTPGGPPPAEYLFWASFGGELRRAPVNGCADGTCIETIVTPSPGVSTGDLAVDSVNGHLYWVNPVDGSIQGAELDGSNLVTLVSGLADPQGIALDTVGERLYWTDVTDGAIRRATLDGAVVETVIDGLTAPVWIDVDETNRHAYFVQSNQDVFSNSESKIRRISLDGATNLQDIYVGTAENAIGVAYSADFLGVVSGLAVDEETGRIYWSDTSAHAGPARIRWVNTDGTEATTISVLPATGSGPAYDFNAFRLYWGLGSSDDFFPPYMEPPYFIRRGPADADMSGQEVITTTENLGGTTDDAPLYLELQYPSPTPPACSPDLYEVDDTPAAATAIEAGISSLSHNFHTAADVDWYTFSLSAGFAYEFEALSGGSEADTVLELYDTDGATLLESNDDNAGGGPDSRIAYSPLSSGVYYARVTNKTTTFATPCDSGYALRLQIASVEPPPPLTDTQPAEVVLLDIDSAVLTPTDGTLISAPGPVTIEGTAFSNLDTISSVDVSVDGAVVDTVVPAPDGTWTTGAWSPATEGVYTLASLAIDASANVQTETHPITVRLDLAPPSLSVAGTVFTQTHLIAPGQILLEGFTADSHGVSQVELRFAGGLWQPAHLEGNTWRLPWIPATITDGGSLQVEIRATDKAGRTTTITDTLTVDIAAPHGTPLTLTHQSALTPTLLLPGNTVNQANPTLEISWNQAADGNGVAGYYAGFTTSPTATADALAFYPGAGTHTQLLGEAEIVYGHLIVVDNLGNSSRQSTGPIYVDGPATPDLLGDFDYRGWLDSGGSQLGADREVSRGPYAGSPFGVTQEFYLSWDNTTLGVSWAGANWAGDGDLFIYLDTGSGGATRLYNPFAAPAAITLPAGMSADYLIWVQDATTAMLLEYSGDNWTAVTALGSDNFRHNPAALPATTDLYLPFNLLGIDNGSSLGLLAVASEEGALRLWAAAPDRNPLNSARSINPQAAGRDLNEYALTLYHHWPSLALGQEPNGGRFANSDLQLRIESAVPAVSAGYLNSDLLDLLAPGMPLDGDEDGQIDVALPGNVESVAVGNGQLLTYSVHFANRGGETATDVSLALAGSTALDVSANPVVNLGDIAPGTAGSATFTATVTGPSADSVELQATLSDGAHGAYDWFWLQNAVDTDAPSGLQLLQPATYARPMTQTLTGFVQDDSPVPQITIRIQKSPGGGTFTTSCSDPTPGDGVWVCRLDFGDLAGFDEVAVHLRATDAHGNTSPFTAPVYLQVDTEAPTVTLNDETENALADGLITASESLFGGTVADDFQANAIEICNRGTAQYLTCITRPLRPGDTPEGAWSYLLPTAGLDGITHTVALRAFDGANNASAPLTLTFQIDTVAPTLAVTQLLTSLDSAASGPGTLTGSPILSGTVSDGGGLDRLLVRVQAPGGAITYQTLSVDGNRWTFSPDLAAQGQYTFFVEAYDRAGNGSAAGPFVVVVAADRVFLPLIANMATLTGGRRYHTYLPTISSQAAPRSRLE